ncbi:unnamed protein product [Urochloa humidicola]
MDKRMHLSVELDKANSCTDQESHGEQFSCGDANSGLVLKFEMSKYWTFPSEPTFALHEVRSTDKENARDPSHNVEFINCAQKVLPLLEHSEDANVALVEMPMAHAWHAKHGTCTLDLSHSVTRSSDARSSGETADMRDDAAEFLTTLVKGVGNETVKVPSPSSSAEGFLCTICNKTFSSNQGLGSHMSVHKKHKKSISGDGAENSSVSSEQCTLKYVCRKCKERFPTRKLLGGHIRKHWREALKKTPSARWKNRKPPMPISSARRKNRKPPMTLARETVQSSGQVVLPTDDAKQPPVLLGSDNMRPTEKVLAVANAAVHQPLPLDFDAVQQQQKSKRLGNEPAAKQILPAERCVPDLNMLPPDEIDGWEG